MDRSISVQTVLSAFQPLLSLRVDRVSEIGQSILLPEFEETIIAQLCEETTTFLAKRPIVLNIDPPIYVVGDIHGNLIDLIRIFALAKSPPTSRFLFLGDYVDRGSCSIEVVCLLYALQIAFPEHVYMIRGNHEFEAINIAYGFQDEVLAYYSTDLFVSFIKSFENLPLAAVILNEIFCVHGGLSPQLKSIEQIEAIRRPLKNYELDFVADMLWSDPNMDNTSYVRSNRGSGVTFGQNEVFEFLKKFGMKYVFRAHQCVKDGIQKFGDTPLYTIFSSSNYDENSSNWAGLIFVKRDLQFQAFSLPPIQQLEKGTANTHMHELPKIKDDDSKASYSVTVNMKLKELSKTSQSSLGFKTKTAFHFDKYYNKMYKSPSSSLIKLPPLFSNQ